MHLSEHHPILVKKFAGTLAPSRDSLLETRRGNPFDRRPSTAEAPPIGKIHPFSKMSVTFEPLLGF